MRFCRFVDRDGIHYGLVETEDGVDAITAVLGGPGLQVSETGVPETVLLPDLSKAKALKKAIPLDSAVLLVPSPVVSKIVCMGRNYREHAKEFGHATPVSPIIFLKPPSSLLAHGGRVVKPKLCERFDHEAELAIVISRPCHRLRPGEDVADYILGYSCLNDITARDLQQKDGQWTRGKGFDTCCPVGPVISTALDPSNVRIQGIVNGQIRQDANTNDLIFNIDFMMRFIADVMTLLPGDIIATGTPAGVGPMNVGDTVEVKVEGIGTLRNIIIEE